MHPSHKEQVRHLLNAKRSPKPRLMLQLNASFWQLQLTAEEYKMGRDFWRLWAKPPTPGTASSALYQAELSHFQPRASYNLPGVLSCCV